MRNIYVGKAHLLSLLLLFSAGACTNGDGVVRLKIIETTDIHGNFYADSNIGNQQLQGNLAKVETYVRGQREQYDDNLILIDNGDLLQGQPITYYYNYVDTVSPHLAAEMLNYMHYDIGNVGNHDVETGHSVLRRFVSECDFPVLSANSVDVVTGKPRFQPYVMLERDGVKMAFLGLVTSAIPVWVPESQWRGMRFDDMEATARRWMPIIQEEEPDLIIGVFHTGAEAYSVDRTYRENAAVEVVQRVPGFDMALIGHDHLQRNNRVVNIEGDTVLVVNPGHDGESVADVEITCQLKGGKVVDKKYKVMLPKINSYKQDSDFMAHFAQQREAIDRFVTRKVGRLAETISTRDAYFGPSPFIGLMQRIQLDVCKADISLASPLAFNTEIRKGDVNVSDIFRFYTFENLLYTLDMSGREIKEELEMSYNLWTNRMLTPDEHLLLLRENPLQGEGERGLFVNYTSNFDAAAGIIYKVDVTRPMGDKVRIISMSNGAPFLLDKMYRVAVNSYRGNGGGEMLTKGAGISFDELKTRIRYISPHDFRYYLIDYFEHHNEVAPPVMNNWEFIPEEWTKTASKRDYDYLMSFLKEEAKHTPHFHQSELSNY